MRPLIIDAEAKGKIAAVLDYAEKHRLPRSELERRVNLANQGKPEQAVGDDPLHACYLEMGFKVVCSIEEQPMGWCKHISVSVDDPKKVPHIEAVRLIMREFGVTHPLEKCYVYIEEAVTPKAINVIAPIES